MISATRRIALVTPYYRPIVGGITTFVESLAAGVRARGFDVRIWTRHGDPGPDVEAGPSAPRSFARWARARIARWRPDVVHAQAHWYALAAAFRGRNPIARRTVFTIHTEWSSPRNPIRETALRRLLARADAVTCVSERRMLSLRERFPDLRGVRVVHPGVRALRADPDAVARVVTDFGLSGSEPVLCTVSMMVWPEKVRGLELLVRSLPLIRERHPSATLLIVGEGPLWGRVEDAVGAMHARDHVRLVGAREDPAPFLLASNFSVHCSFQDAFPQSVLESVLLGRTVLINEDSASAFPGDPEDLGLLPVPSTPEGIADGVTRLASDPRYRDTLASKGRLAVADRFSWSKSVDRFVDLYGL